MENFRSVLGEGAGGALCSVLSAYGASAPLLTTLALIEPTPGGEALAVGAGLASLAAEYGCNWDPNGSGPALNPSDIQGCMRAGGGSHLEIYVWSKAVNPDGDWVLIQSGNVAINGTRQGDVSGNPTWFVETTNLDTGVTGETAVTLYPDGSNAAKGVAIDGPNGEPAQCETPAPSGVAPRPAPVPYTDPNSGCEINVTLLGWTLGPANQLGANYLIEPAPAARASGGVIGGCNFDPVVYILPPGGGGGGGGGGNPPIVPLPPGGGPISGDDWWKQLVIEAIDGVYEWAISRALDEYFAPSYPEQTRTIQAACNYQQDGQLEEFSVTYPEQKFPERLLSEIDSLSAFQQQILKWRTPVCFGNHTSGEPYTLTWVSDEKTPAGRTLLKQMKYWDQTGKTLEEHFLHWKDFVWQAGPIMVGVAGSVLGKMQVWAATESEGRRVVDHAASISGVTLSPENYIVSTTAKPRVGQAGTMRLKNDGYRWWIGNRSTPAGPATYPRV